MMDGNALRDKGGVMEELLRNYFLKLGYYVLRGVRLNYKEAEITDIDLFLYGKISSISREIAIVDVKNKKRSKSAERVLFVIGLMEILNANKAVIATTDRRDVIREFANDNNVLVLDGSFLDKLRNNNEGDNDRLSDEEFYQMIDNYPFEKLDGNWKEKVIFSKSLCASGLNFNNCNICLRIAKFFAEQVIIKDVEKNIALRCLLLLCSFIAISLDYCLKDVSFLNQNERKNILIEGLLYGERGRAETDRVLKRVSRFLNDYAGKSLSLKFENETKLGARYENAEILGEYISKTAVCSSLFSVAREFESFAMSRKLLPFSAFSNDFKSILFCLLDFWNMDRKKFMDF